jgi:SNF2 family DNA or RNA helicase
VKWRDEIKFGDNWKSSRIIKIIDVFNEFRDKDPDCSVIIFDESVYFLDIVEIAFSNMFEPEACLRYDGRTVEGKRSAILEAFAALGGPRVLLASRGAGGIGLNITTANKVILCCPWWKVELGKQAIKRVHRDGQKRPVEAVYIQAHCIIESLKARKRDYKHKHNMKVMNGVERVDGIIPKAWDDLD